MPGQAHVGLGILTDQINLTGRNPLAEWDGLRDVESPFVDMNEAYSPYLRTIARGVADDLGIAVEEGVYAGVLGPCFETPAEVAALRALGVSYVGMSTVLEVIMARALGMNVLGLTLAANESGAPAVSHETVLDAAGGYADGRTAAILRALGRPAEAWLDDNDAWHALAQTGGLLRTGPTGTNVNDLSVLLIGKPRLTF